MSTEQDHPAAEATLVKRRDFLKVLGVSTAATTMLGCASEQVEKLIPYLVSPDQTVPGVSTYYATTCRECSVACGVIGGNARTVRTIKLEAIRSSIESRRAVRSWPGRRYRDCTIRSYRGPMIRRKRTASGCQLGRSAQSSPEDQRDA